MDKKLMIGQRLAVGFDGPTIPQDFVDLVRDYKVGNIILFRRNVKSYEQLRALCADILRVARGGGFDPAGLLDRCTAVH